MDENCYNTRVRHAISDELIESRNRKHNLVCRCERIRNYLKESEDTVKHKEYLNLMDELSHLEDMINTLQISINIWDQARELCMNIADEMVKEDCMG